MSAPQLVFGTATFGAQITTLDEVQRISSALQSGSVCRIDTAARYPSIDSGASEKLLGLADYQKKFTIDTKVLLRGSLVAKSISDSLAKSLASLKTDQVDVFYLHMADKVTPLADQAAAFDAMYREGKFKRLGVSNMEAGMLEDWIMIASEHGWVRPTVYQGQYNLLLARVYDDLLFPLLRRNSISFVAYSPLAGGFLTGKFRPDSKQADLVGTRFEVGENNAVGKVARSMWDTPIMHSAIAELRRTSDRSGVSMEALAYRWLAYHSGLDMHDGVIFGASRASQVDDALKMFEAGPLTVDVLRQLEDVSSLCKDEAATIVSF